jgi:hypothetical protein
MSKIHCLFVTNTSRVIVALICLLTIPPVLAADKPFCILPLFNELSGSFPSSNLVSEISRLKTQVGQNGTNFKVGFSTTLPLSAPDLLRYCQLAQTSNISLGVIFALQTHDVPGSVANIAAADFRNYQWRLDGVTWQGVVTNDPRDYLVVTPSRYATAIREEFESLTHAQAVEAISALTNYPGVIVAVDACIEEELATGVQTNDAYLGDYSPFAITEFRDWLRHTGKYDDVSGQFAGQGAGEAIVGPFLNMGGVMRSQFYDDPTPANANGTGQSFNARFGTSFTTWNLRYWDLGLFPASITNVNFSPTPQSGAGFASGGFDAPRVRNPTNLFWCAWSWDYQDQNNTYPPGNPAAPAFGFRQFEVRSFPNDMLGWLANQGVPVNLLYAHQIPSEQVGADRNRSSGSPIWTGLCPLNRQAGITRFGDLNTDQLQQYSTDWGVFEWHPLPNSTPTNPALYTATVSNLDNCYYTGARCLFPGWWYTNGAPVDPVFPLPDSEFAMGIHDWLNAHPDVPPPSCGTGSGLVGTYFNNPNLANSPVITNVDGVVNFNWAGAAPLPGVNGTNFSVNWTGWVLPRYTETNTFYVTSDGGAQLWVNGQLVVNDWTSHSARESSGTISLNAGQLYAIQLEYFETTGSSTVTFSWSSATQPKQIIPRSQLFPSNQTNASPIISLIAPESGSSLAANSVTLLAYAAGRSGAVTNIQFFANGVNIGGTTNAASPALIWTNVAPGSYLITALGADNGGNSSTSLPVVIAVAAPPNPPKLNLITNGDFTANAAFFGTLPGYIGGGNPSAIANWTQINGGGIGVNGAAAPVGDLFGPTITGGRTYLFLQLGSNGACQNLAFSPGLTYQLNYDVAARNDNPNALYQILIAANNLTGSTNYFDSGVMPGNTSAFNHFSATFKTGATVSGTANIQLWNKSPAGDNTVDFANISLTAMWPSGTTLASSENPSASGDTVTLTATVTTTNGIPTGFVTFNDGNNLLNSVTLSNGLGNSATAVLSISTLAIGSHNLTAGYSGDTNFVSSLSSVLSQTVNPPTPLSSGTVLVDFNGSGGTPPSPTNGIYWNDAVITQGGGRAVAINGSAAPLALVDTTNGTPGWTLAITNLTGWNSSGASSWLYYNGPYPAAVSNFPSTALNEYVAINDAGSPGPALSVTLSGLATNRTYNLLIYGACAAGFGAVTGPQTNTLTVGDSTSPATVSFNALSNSTTVVVWSNITPNASGQIAFTIDAPNGAALNFMELTLNTSTNAPTALGGITGGASSGNSLTLNWTASANVHLQSATNLAPPVVWTDVPNTTGQGSATITTTNARMFFRLIQP